MFTNIINQTFLNTEFVHDAFSAKKLQLKKQTLFIPPEIIRQLTYTAFSKIEFYFRQNHTNLLCGRLSPQSDAGENDRFVIKTILDNACVAANKTYCLCQDTGTACVYVWKDENIRTGEFLIPAINEGIEEAWKHNNLRASQIEAV
ncbi:MAG: fumarate hydratase, partial [Candidatus Symbiothrix sp.]|nr:fumarate hydratase [Candidatus Symbiothrix sp.]